MITKCKQQIEKFDQWIKGWMITKINNSRGLKQDRVFILTSQRFYTFKYELDKTEVKVIHSKGYDVGDFVRVEIGKLVRNKQQKKTTRYAMAIYTVESEPISPSTILQLPTVKLLKGVSKKSMIHHTERSDDSGMRVHYFKAPKSIQQDFEQRGLMFEKC